MVRDLEDYFRIRFENKIAIRPRREDCHLAAATRLLAKKHELEEVGKEVKDCQKWFDGKMNEISLNREELEERENGLKKSMLKFEHFLRENDSKRHRGLAKIAEEQRLQTSKDSDIEKLKSELAELNTEKEKIQWCVDKNIHCYDFMRKAVHSSDQFEEIPDLLGRCDVLLATKDYLTERDAKLTSSVQEEKSDMVQFSENNNTELLRMNNLMSELQTRYDRAQRVVISSENNWMRIKNTAAKQTLLLGQIRMAVLNLYQLCSRYHQARLLDQEELVVYTEASDQLMEIQNIMADIFAVHKECVRAQKKHV